MTTRRTWLAIAGLALLGSQAGHLLIYQLRFGPAAQQLQSSGAHLYYPAVAKTAAGVIAVIAIGSLLTVGLARALAGRALARKASAPPFLRGLAALYTLQLAVFIAQEIAEAAAAGTPSPSPMLILLWGTLGQLPIAAVAALALRWLLTRFSEAASQIGAAVRAIRFDPPTPTAAVRVAPGWYREVPRHHSAGPSFCRRGPPFSPRFSLD